MKKVSASKLAAITNLTGKEVREKLVAEELMVGDGKVWSLTDKGVKAGGELKNSQYGEYIAWPEDIFNNNVVKEEPPPYKQKQRAVNSTKIGAFFNCSPTKANKILAEIGWIERGVKGWKITDAGSKKGGYEKDHYQSGVPYVVWAETILEDPVLLSTIQALTKGSQESAAEFEIAAPSSDDDFRKKYEAKYRTRDGHYVRSRAEAMIDDWLYISGLVHAYERKLPIEEDVYSDFYLPDGKVYIEFWGMENEPAYLRRKGIKQLIYKKYDYNLIELTDSDIMNLDDVLPKVLLRFGISTE